MLNLQAENPTEGDLCRGKGYLWMGIADGVPGPDLAWLKTCLLFIDRELEEEHTVLVHCAAGISRSSLVMTGWLMQHMAADFPTALKALQERHLDPNRPAQPNSVFWPVLEAWQAELERGKLQPA